MQDRGAKCDSRDFSISGITHPPLLWRDGFDRRVLTGPGAALGFADLQLGRRSQDGRIACSKRRWTISRTGSARRPSRLARAARDPAWRRLRRIQADGAARKSWRERLRIGERDLVLLFMAGFVSRQAHPLPMYWRPRRRPKAIKARCI